MAPIAAQSVKQWKWYGRNKLGENVYRCKLCGYITTGILVPCYRCSLLAKERNKKHENQ